LCKKEKKKLAKKKKSCQEIVKKETKIVRKLSKSFQKVLKKLQKVVKKLLYSGITKSLCNQSQSENIMVAKKIVFEVVELRIHYGSKFIREAVGHSYIHRSYWIKIWMGPYPFTQQIGTPHPFVQPKLSQQK
jgi:hypothetical protein